MTDQERELDLSPASDVDEGVPPIGQALNDPATDADDDRPGQATEPAIEDDDGEG